MGKENIVFFSEGDGGPTFELGDNQLQTSQLRLGGDASRVALVCIVGVLIIKSPKEIFDHRHLERYEVWGQRGTKITVDKYFNDGKIRQTLMFCLKGVVAL